jgi:hypothetical protein
MRNPLPKLRRSIVAIKFTSCWIESQRIGNEIVAIFLLNFSVSAKKKKLSLHEKIYNWCPTFVQSFQKGANRLVVYLQENNKNTKTMSGEKKKPRTQFAPTFTNVEFSATNWVDLWTLSMIVSCCISLLREPKKKWNNKQQKRVVGDKDFVLLRTVTNPGVTATNSVTVGKTHWRPQQ